MSSAVDQFLDAGMEPAEALGLVDELLKMVIEAIESDPVSTRKVFAHLVRIHLEPGFGEFVKKGHCGMPEPGYKVPTGEKKMFRILYRIENGKPVDIDIGNRADIYKGRTNQGRAR